MGCHRLKRALKAARRPPPFLRLFRLALRLGLRCVAPEGGSLSEPESADWEASCPPGAFLAF